MRIGLGLPLSVYTDRGKPSPYAESASTADRGKPSPYAESASTADRGKPSPYAESASTADRRKALSLRGSYTLPYTFV